MQTTRRDAGFTLMELMVVMVIAASLMGLGAGLFTSMGKRTASQSALANLQSTIVGVRNASSRFPSMIVVDPDSTPPVVQGLYQEVLQEFHFDPRAVPGGGAPTVAWGIEGRQCNPGGAQVVDGGRVGGALRLGGGRVDCGNYAAYDVTDGVTVELYMKPDGPLQPADLVTKGEALRLRIEQGGKLTGSIGVKAEHGSEKATTTAQLPPVKPGQWIGVRLSYDRNELALATDTGYGWVQRGTPKIEDRRMALAPDQNLLVGGFSGLLDDFRFAGVHATTPLEMPPGVKLIGVGKKPYKPIHFIGGRLDPTVHFGPQDVIFEADNTRTILEVATNGTLTVTTQPASAPVEEKKPGEKAPPKKE